MSISWLPPKNIPGILRQYEIGLKDQSTKSPVTGFPKTYGNSTISVTYTDLQAFTDYSLELTATTIHKSLPYIHHFKTPESIPGPPMNVQAVSINEGKIISVRWEPPQFPNGNITNYKVRKTLFSTSRYQ